MSDEPLGDVIPALTRILTPTGVPVSTIVPNPRPPPHAPWPSKPGT